jgi:hypothetical protein
MICTISSASFWPRAKLALESALLHNPDETGILLTDELEIAKHLSLDFVKRVGVVHPRHLGLDHDWLLTGRPKIVEYALEHGDYAYFVDGDTFTYGPFEEAERELEDYDLLVVPHTLRPWPEDGKNPRMLQLNLMGNYNTGFLAAAPGALDFVSWWSRQTALYPNVDVHAGNSGEQGWLRYALDFCPTAKVFKHPGYNLAYWNIPDRAVTRSDDGYDVDGAPLRLMHFSGFSPSVDPGAMSCHQERHYLDNGSVEIELFENYAKLLGWVNPQG